MVELAGRRLRVPSARAALHGGFTTSHLPLGLTASLIVGALAFANGGYFPVAWGWSGLALFWVAAIALALGVAVEVGVYEVLFLGALAAFGGWQALSLIWTSNVPETVLEVERTLIYLAAALAGLMLIKRSSVTVLLGSLWVAITVVSGYGLATRLFPDQLGVYDPVSGSRLSEPVGYWNAFGVLAAMGTLLALGLAARSGPAVRCFAAASTVITMLTLYFTYSRGAWIAFFCGLAAAVLLEKRRLQLITSTFVVAPFPAIAVWSASRSDALTHVDSTLASASSDGHGLAVIAILLMVGAALTILVLDWAETAVKVPRMLARFYAGLLLFILAASLISIFGRYGFPPTLARKAYHAFVQPAPQNEGNLNKRLFSLSGNGRSEQFHTAWQQAGDHPVVGGGAGSFDTFWFAHRRVDQTVHDAHNLYLETLSELGPPGLFLLGLMLAVPLAAMRRARSSPFASLAFGAYVTYLLHAAIDWDWEMPAITLTALFCGLGLLALARGDRRARPLRPHVRWGALGATAALVVFVLLGLLGNAAVSGSSKSTNSGHYKRAESQAKRATHFAPWSAEPWRRLAEAQVLSGQKAKARANFRTAISKDPRDWTLWFELAQASGGKARTAALAEASRLNPKSPEIAELRAAGSGE